MSKNPKSDVSAAEAVVLGALASGVNNPTWNTLKSTFLLLGFCLLVMLGLAWSLRDFWLFLCIGLFVVITATLFLLLSWFLSHTGFASIEHQMQELELKKE